jgi:hypothetical protein
MAREGECLNFRPHRSPRLHYSDSRFFLVARLLAFDMPNPSTHATDPVFHGENITWIDRRVHPSNLLSVLPPLLSPKQELLLFVYSPWEDVPLEVSVRNLWDNMILFAYVLVPLGILIWATWMFAVAFSMRRRRRDIRPTRYTSCYRPFQGTNSCCLCSGVYFRRRGEYVAHHHWSCRVRHHRIRGFLGSSQ